MIIAISVPTPTFNIGEVTAEVTEVQAGCSIEAVNYSIIFTIIFLICWTSTKKKNWLVATKESGSVENYTLVSLFIFNAIFALGNGSFWKLCFFNGSDTIEVNKFVKGERREGILVVYSSSCSK